MLDNLDVGVVVHASDGAIVFANTAACAFLGLSKSEIAARSTRDGGWDVIHPDGTAFQPGEFPVEVCLRTGEPVRGSVQGVARPGDGRIWLRVTAQPVRDSAGSIVEVFVSFTDISDERRRVDDEKQVREASEQLYASVLRAMSEGVAVHDPTGRIRFSNPAAERILGLTTAQLLGREAVDARWALRQPDGGALPPAEIPSELTRLTGQPVFERHLVVSKPDGSRAHLAVSTDPIAGTVDSSPWVVATFTDITAQEDAREALRATAQRLEAVTNAVPGILFQYLIPPGGGPGRYVFVSGDTRSMLGVEPEAVVENAQALVDRVVPEDLPRLSAAVNEALARRSPLDFEFRLRAATGDRWCRSRATLTPHAEGTVLTGLIVDVTEQKRLEEGLRRAQRREVLGDLAAGIAHNFNNMLSIVLANLEEARRVTPEASAVLDDALVASRRSVELVRQLMRVARGEPEGQAEVTELSALVSEVARLCGRTFDAGIEVVTSLPAGPVHVRADASQLQQAVLNLAVNARDAMEGRPLRRLTLAVRDGPVAAIEVRDTGHGISAGHLPRLGEVFFTTKSPTKGTGLGLATIATMLREVGGAMKVASTPGEGSTFTLELPRAVPSEPTVRPERDGQVVSHRLRVLVVDDEPLLRKALARVLTPQCESVTLVASGDEAITLVAAQPQAFDLVLLDLSMPGLAGHDVLQRLQALAAGLPIVVLSGNVNARERLAGAFDVVEKPISGHQLATLLGRVPRRA
ncbi:MAG: PAS domain S-box protein [Myxococcaceae bacterium]|nr:PAS domain S-box protein [Myxococcaceae bacterium]